MKQHTAKFIAPSARQRCEAERQTKYANDMGDPPYKCKMLGSYEIDGVKLCGKHASLEALSILLEQSRDAR